MYLGPKNDNFFFNLSTLQRHVTKVQRCTSENMRQAIKYFRQGDNGLRDASRRYGIPTRSLKRRRQSGDLAYSPDALRVFVRGRAQKPCEDIIRQGS